MPKSIKVEIHPEDIIQAVMRMKRKEREVFHEDLIAATSMEYLISIEEAREDYQVGRIKTHDEIFGR